MIQNFQLQWAERGGRGGEVPSVSRSILSPLAFPFSQPLNKLSFLLELSDYLELPTSRWRGKQTLALNPSALSEVFRSS